MQPPHYVTDFGELREWGLPADLTDEEATYIAKAKHDAIMDVFDKRMADLKNFQDFKHGTRGS